MKITKISCDFCCEEIKPEEGNELHTLNVPVYLDLIGNGGIIKNEYHFCGKCYSFRLHSSLTDYELKMQNFINEHLKYNKWKM